MKVNIAWLIGFGLVVAISILSLMPQPPTPLHFSFADKVEHSAGYFALGLYFLCLTKQTRVVFAVFLLGVGLECIQAFLPWRTFDMWDLVANGLGAVLSYAAYLLFWKKNGKHSLCVIAQKQD